MSLLTKLYIGIGLLVVLVGGGYAFKHHYDQKLIHLGELQQLNKQLTTKDSAQMQTIKQLGDQVIAASLAAGQTIDHWHTTTRVDTVKVPGKRDSIFFHDTAFAKLPDSTKVDVLIAEGNKQAKACSDLRNTCKAFKDSAFAVFRTKDSIIQVARDVFKTTPTRRCGLGGTVGGIAGFGKILNDTARVSSWKPVVGFGVAAGIACRL